MININSQIKSKQEEEYQARVMYLVDSNVDARFEFIRKLLKRS